MSFFIKKLKLKIKKIKYKAFSIVEAVIAMAILVLLITPTFDFIINLINISKNIQDRAEMVNLSYEGLEFMINLRENLKKECAKNWNDGITFSGVPITPENWQSVCRDNTSSSDQINSGLGFQIFSDLVLAGSIYTNPGCNGATTTNISTTNLCQIDINYIASSSIIYTIISNRISSPPTINSSIISPTSYQTTKNDSPNSDHNRLLKLYKQNYGSADYASSTIGASSTKFARLIWVEKEGVLTPSSRSDVGTEANLTSAIKVYSLVCIIPAPNTKNDANPCNPLIKPPDLSKRVILSTSIYR